MRLLKILLIFLFFPACADKPEKNPKEKKEDSSKPRIVGRVASIPAGREFVLIQSYGSWTVENGSILTTQGPDGRAANLRATGEKLGQYAAADIQSGTLESGDAVYTIAKLPEAPAKPEAEEKPQPVEEATSPEVPAQ